MERAMRFYDCLTEIGDRYILDAEEYAPEQKTPYNGMWRRWTGIAAALALVVGLSFAVAHYFPRMGSAADVAAGAEAPSASAPAVAAPEAAPMEPAPVPATGEGSDKFADAAPAAPEQTMESSLKPGQEIHFENGEVDVILTQEQAAVCGMPEDLESEVEGKTPMWLEFTGEWYVPTEGPSAYALFVYSPDLGIISDGTHYFAVAVQFMP